MIDLSKARLSAEDIKNHDAVKNVWANHDELTDEEFWDGLYTASAQTQLQACQEEANRQCKECKDEDKRPNTRWAG